MNVSFQALAVSGSEQYYDYLEKVGKGLAAIDVVQILHTDPAPTIFDLVLAQHPRTTDDLQIQIKTAVYEQSEIRTILYDKDTHTLQIAVSAQALGVFLRAAPADVQVVSDLRFLVKRVRSWYVQYGTQICMPCSKPNVFAYRGGDVQQPSDDQAEAIHGALHNPFSYVWGAPGTGKTKLVLSQCILAYLESGKRILISAPTNNAVEQTLYGVLDVLKKAGIAYNGRLLRLGTASAEFAEKYPGVCEKKAYAQSLSALSDELLALSAEITDLETGVKQRKELAALQKRQELFSQIKAELYDNIDLAGALQQEQKEKKLRRDLLASKRTAASAQLRTQKQELEHSISQAKSLSLAVERYSSGWRRWLLRKRLINYQNSLTKALDESEKCSVRKEATEQTIADIDDELEVLDAALEQLPEQWKPALRRIDTLLKRLNPRFSVSADYTYRGEFLADRLCTALEQSEMRLRTQIEQLTQEQSDKETPLEDMQNALDEKRQRLADLEEKKGAQESALGAAVSNCQILAATVDTCLGRLPPGSVLSDFAHVFLDEAGYCSLVKAATLTAYHCPLTFLGDHMQLPPVCEMNDADIEKHPAVAVWAQSALYVEDALTGGDVARGYLKHEAANFVQMQKFDLVHTYRFGEALASVLANNVYSEQFHGDLANNTEIYFIHAKKSRGKMTRTNTGEREAIWFYLQMHPDEDIGVITPYRNQRTLLTEVLKKYRGPSETALTVHGAQGREWDTVLFSVVDTTDKWFTSTKIPESNGLQIINTAVSRAKKKLILVCDYDYWSKQENELLGELLKVAQPI